MKAMYLNLPSRLALLTAGCALASALLWGWSRGLPEPNWESSSAPIASASVPEPGAVPSSPSAKVAEAALTPRPRRKAQPKATPPPVKKELSSVAVQASAATPEPLPTVPPVTPTPEPSPAVAQATPEPTPEPSADPVAIITPTPTPEPPRPSDAELAGPLPEHGPGEPMAPAATPVRLGIADIARQPQLWPPQVVLVASQRFPVVIKGVNVGSVQVPAGRPVILRKVNPDGILEIEFQGSPAKVKAQATDFMTRALALASAREKAGGQ